jgi:hypothetical protein
MSAYDASRARRLLRRVRKSFPDDFGTYSAGRPGSRISGSATSWPLLDARNLNVYPRAGLGATVAATMCRLLFGTALVDVLPDNYVYQRGYVASR